MPSSRLLLWPLGLLALAAGGWCLLAPPLTAQDNGFGASTANVRLADGFDFPVGPPNAEGYYKARGYVANGHLGDDWDGNGGGNTDLGLPVYCMGQGVVVLAGNMRMGWGNVVMVRHSFCEPTEGNAVRTVDSLYGHLDTILVRPGEVLRRNQQLGTIGTGGGLYDAHLHFEVRKNINIGMFRSSFARDDSNYYDPTAFINARRQLRSSGNVLIALNTFRPLSGEQSSLPPADGAYELGINRSAGRLAEMETSAKLSKSAFSIKRRGAAETPSPTPATGNGAFDKINRAFQVDRYEDERRRKP